jgi:AraC family transcriptional regulator of adaptative response / DNA-3-methyladenine glycosylase II
VGIRLADVRALPALLEQVARRFDTHADIATIEAHLSADPLLAPRIAARPGLRPDTPWDCFESAVLALLPPADLDAFLHRYATPLPDALRLPGLTRLFPPPATVAAAQPAALRRLAAAAMEATGDEPPSTFADPVLALRAAAWQPWVAYAVRHLAHRSDSSPD